MTMISRVLGLVRDIVLAHHFPVGGVTDAFFAAFRIPNLLRRLVAEGAFSLAFIPVLSEYKETRSKESLQDLLDHVAGMFVTILLIISIVGVVAAPLIMWLFTMGFEYKVDARPVLAADLLRITFPYILFISLSAFVASILNTYQRFAIPAFTPVLLNVVLIISIVWVAPFFDEPIKAVAWGVFVGGVAQLAFQLPALYRLGVFPRFKLKRHHEGVKRILKLMVPALFGSSVAQINLLLNTVIASFLAVGSLSWLYYSDRFVELPLALFGVAIGTVILPKLSADRANTNTKAFGETLDWATRLGILFALPATVGLIVLAKPILATVIYGHDAWKDVEMSSLSLMTYSLGLPAFILVKVLAPGFFSRQDTKTPVKIGIISIFVNMVLNILIVLPWYLMGYIGAHAGLALSTALAAYTNAGLLFYRLRKQGVYLPQQGWILFLTKIAVAALVMGAVIWWVMPQDSWWQDARFCQQAGWLGALILLSVGVYFVSLFAMGLNIRKLLAHS
jgi:putative peptidoglycan lipid II flippase